MTEKPKLCLHRAANHTEKWKAEGSSKQVCNRIHAQARTAVIWAQAQLPHKTHVPALVMQFRQVGAPWLLWLFKQTALSPLSQGLLKGWATPQDSTRKGCMLSRHANHPVWPNIKAQLPSKIGFLLCLPSHSLTFSSINSKPFARSWFCQEKRDTCICLLGFFFIMNMEKCIFVTLHAFILRLVML